jgi:cell division protein FtsW
MGTRSAKSRLQKLTASKDRGAGPARTKKANPLEHRLLLTATFCLLAGGAVMVYSSSSARTVLQGGGDGTGYLIKYVEFSALGLVGMYVVSRLPLSLIRKITPWILGLTLLSLVAVLIPGIGSQVNGARRWLGAGMFQPSEALKVALIMHCATVIATRPRIARELRLLIGPVLTVAGVGVLLVAAQPDLGTALVICFSLASLLIAAGLPLRQLGLLFGSGAFLVMVFALIEPYRRARLTSFINPWADASGSGFQSVQGQIAVGSGGLFGLGPGGSVQKVFYLPEAHTDFILAVIGEELGLAGIFVLLSLYGIIAYAGLRTAKKASGVYAKLLAAGLTSLILCQASLNAFAVLGLAPLTGVPLPLVSSGSSSLLVMLAGMGLLLNVARGGSAHLQALPSGRRKSTREPTKARSANSSNRGGRDGRTRRTGTRGRRRAAG